MVRRGMMEKRGKKAKRYVIILRGADEERVNGYYVLLCREEKVLLDLKDLLDLVVELGGRERRVYKGFQGSLEQR